MKYLKTYEGIESKYNSGDYIVMKTGEFLNFEFSDSTINTFKILKTSKKNDYEVETLDNNSIDIIILYDKEIKRLAKSNEIEKFEFLKSTLKFNL